MAKRTLNYLNMCARVTVEMSDTGKNKYGDGSVTFRHINSVRIEETVTDLGNKATVVIPRSFKRLADGSVLDMLQVGKKVKIELGYNGYYQEEFSGYIRRINAETPVTIECDDWYPLRQTKHIKAWQAITLRDFLAEIMPSGITIDAPEINLGKVSSDGASTYELVRRFCQEYAMYARLIKDAQTGQQTFYVSLPFDNQLTAKSPRWIYHRQKNVRASNLEWKTEQDWLVRVQVSYKGDKGKIHALHYGDPGKTDCREIKATGLCASKAEAEIKGKSLYHRAVYNGFTGSITGFGTPATHAGDSLQIQDDLEPSRQGTYAIRQVIINYGQGGFSRENTLAYKLPDN